MSAPLTKHQKFTLSQLARRAYGEAKAKAGVTGEQFDLGEAEWRQAQVAAACGKYGLRCASQNDYAEIQAHFLNLIGESGRALVALIRGQSNGWRIAWHKLHQAVAEARDVGITREYVATICRTQFKCALLEASEKQLWNLIFTVRNRAGGKRKAKG